MMRTWLNMCDRVALHTPPESDSVIMKEAPADDVKP